MRVENAKVIDLDERANKVRLELENVGIDAEVYPAMKVDDDDEDCYCACMTMGVECEEVVAILRNEEKGTTEIRGRYDNSPPPTGNGDFLDALNCVAYSCLASSAFRAMPIGSATTRYFICEERMLGRVMKVQKVSETMLVFSFKRIPATIALVIPKKE